MSIELPKEARALAIASIERWFQTERDERVGNITAGALLDQLRAIYNGVDPVRFAPGKTRMAIAGSPCNGPALWLVGTVGRMQTAKAQPLLAQAFVAALQQQPGLRRTLRLVMVGDGPMRAECQAVLQSADMTDLAWQPGERTDVPDAMRGLDCLVLPSLAEGTSNNILEAMACALPVIATDVGANAELVVHRKSGEIVTAADAHALAQALLRVACDPGAAIEAGRFGRQQVERRFGLPAMVAAFEDAYASVLMRGVA